ncbi:MAG: hypothetical protein HN509_17570 [Halobacteriovoraceae bacterium]|jgi:hypothetical protein|nr:hypothetical protein [Halobacteriovoraceae bacterium]
MKSLGLIAVLTLLAPALFAKSKVTDLMFRPSTGAIAFEGGFDYTKESYSIKSASITTREDDRTGSSLRAGATYGVMDTFSFGFNFTYQMSDELEQNNKSVSPSIKTTKKSSGFKEPNFIASYRALDEKGAIGLPLDVTVLVSPSFSDGKEANVTTEGDSLRGGFLADVQGKVGGKLEGFSWEGHLNLSFLGSRKLDNATSGQDELDKDSRMDFSLGGRGQIQIGESIAFDAGLDLVFIGEETTKLTLSNITIKDDSHMNFVLSGKLHYYLIADKLALNGSATYTKVGDFDSTSTQGSNTSTVSQRVDDNIIGIGLGASFLF